MLLWQDLHEDAKVSVGRIGQPCQSSEPSLSSTSWKPLGASLYHHSVDGQVALWIQMQHRLLKMQRFYATNYGMDANALEISVFRLLATQPDCRMQKALRGLKSVWPARSGSRHNIFLEHRVCARLWVMAIGVRVSTTATAFSLPLTE